VWLVAAAVTDLILPEWSDVIAGPALAAAYGSAGFLMLRKRRILLGRERAAWQLVGIGLLLGSTGVAAVAIAHLAVPGLPAFGPLDAFFLAGYAFTLTGLSLLPHLRTETSSRIRLLLDGLVGSLALGTLVWVFLIDHLLDELSRASTFERWVGSAYQIFDLAALVVLMLVAVRRSTFRFDPRVVAAGVAAGCQAAADILYFQRGVGSSFEEADPVYGLYLLAAGGFLFAAARLERTPRPRDYARRPAPWFTLVAPYGAAGALGGITAVRLVGSQLDTTTRFLFLVTFVVVALVVLRQAIAIRENRELVEKDRADLVSSISHELRTPLTGVVGYLDVLTEMDLSDEERKEMMETVRQQAGYLTRIVSDLVTLARQDPEGLGISRRKVPVVELVEAAVSSVDGASEQTKVDVPDHLWASVDPERIQQALVNLVSNAQRYGRGRIQVVGAGIGDAVTIEVHDDGPGVPRRYQELIWQRFERGPNRLNATQPGSGIGLAIVDMIAKAHGGTAEYRRSELLGGACFSITLPGARAVARVVRSPLPAG
jgi:signal transduction histidine kinase